MPLDIYVFHEYVIIVSERSICSVHSDQSPSLKFATKGVSISPASIFLVSELYAQNQKVLVSLLDLYGRKQGP